MRQDEKIADDVDEARRNQVQETIAIGEED
jgi:hypothetical protein